MKCRLRCKLYRQAPAAKRRKKIRYAKRENRWSPNCFRTLLKNVIPAEAQYSKRSGGTLCSIPLSLWMNRSPTSPSRRLNPDPLPRAQPRTEFPRHHLDRSVPVNQ